jgi:hypothetical protein
MPLPTQNVREPIIEHDQMPPLGGEDGIGMCVLYLHLLKSGKQG